MVVNLPCLRIMAMSREDNLLFFSVSIKNDMLIPQEFKKSWRYFKWSFNLKRKKYHRHSTGKRLAYILVDNFLTSVFSWYHRSPLAREGPKFVRRLIFYYHSSWWNYWYLRQSVFESTNTAEDFTIVRELGGRPLHPYCMTFYTCFH